MSHCFAPSVISVRDFIPETDAAWLHGLWHRALHGRWAISLRAMLSKLAGAALLQVAEYGGLPSGFCAIQRNQGGAAGLTLLLVEPTKQHHGIGTDLLNRAEELLRNLGIQRLTLGSGGGDYFWPGVPAEQRQSCSFFRRYGFVEEEDSEDLILGTEDFVNPDWVAARLASSGAMLRLGKLADRDEVMAFERLHFLSWAAYFENEMDQGRYSNILLAQGADDTILGTLLLGHDPSLSWDSMRDKRVGTLNTLGVSPTRQGQGIGLALTSRAMEILRMRGCSHCLIQWTGLGEWYGKLGAETWAHYHMASKTL